MSTATVDIEEEKDRILDEYLAAIRAGDHERAMDAARRMPLPPSMAKSILRDVGKEALMANFNLSEANEFYGEGWMDEYAGEPLFRRYASNGRSRSSAH